MATVVNLAKDTRLSDIGQAIVGATEEILTEKKKKREAQERADAISAILVDAGDQKQDPLQLVTDIFSNPVLQREPDTALALANSMMNARLGEQELGFRREQLQSQEATAQAKRDLDLKIEQMKIEADGQEPVKITVFGPDRSEREVLVPKRITKQGDAAVDAYLSKRAPELSRTKPAPKTTTGDIEVDLINRLNNDPKSVSKEELTNFLTVRMGQFAPSLGETFGSLVDQDFVGNLAEKILERAGGEEGGSERIANLPEDLTTLSPAQLKSIDPIRLSDEDRVRLLEELKRRER